MTDDMARRRFRAGVDIGGTFTDIVLLGDDGGRYTKKVSSTVDDYARAIVDGLAALLGEIGAAAGSIVELLHGTTVASNAILEHKGARTGLITTKGFRDVLEIRNLRMPRLYDMSWTKPPPLVERRSDRGRRAGQRAGRDRRPLDEASVERAVRFLAGGGRGDRGVPAALLPQPGARAAGQGDRAAPRAANRAVRQRRGVAGHQRIRAHLDDGHQRLCPADRRAIPEPADRRGRAQRYRAPPLLMQSNGGLTTAKAAAVTPMHIIESGPAAGVVGVQALTRRIGIPRRSRSTWAAPPPRPR